LRIEADTLHQFVTYQAKEGKVTAVASMGRDPYVAKASELIRLNIMPTLDEIKGGKVCSPFGYEISLIWLSGHIVDRIDQGISYGAAEGGHLCCREEN
jgi:hypothetical protein